MTALLYGRHMSNIWDHTIQCRGHLKPIWEHCRMGFICPTCDIAVVDVILKGAHLSIAPLASSAVKYRPSTLTVFLEAIGHPSINVETKKMKSE